MRLVALAVVTALVACSSSDDEDAAATSASFQALAEAQCQLSARCSPLNLKIQFGDVARCTNVLSTALGAQTNLGGLLVTQGQVDGCKASLASRACNETTDNAACAFKGMLADGVACGVNAQCASGSCFYAATNGVVADCGICTARAVEGQSCAASACAGGLNCKKSSKCVVPAAVNGACTDSFDCAGVLECVEAKCVAPLPKGAACTETSAPCDGSQGLICVSQNATTNTCIEIGVAQVGETCGFIEAENTVKACQRSSCATAGNANSGTCVAFKPAGAACSPQDVPCDSGLECRSGTCKQPDASVCK